MEDFSAFIVALETYRFLLRRLRAFLRRGLWTVLCAAAALFLALHDTGLNLSPDALRGAIAVPALFAALAGIRFAIAWHRDALGPELEGTARPRFGLTYLRASLVILFCALLPPLGALVTVALLGPAVTLPATVIAAFLTAIAIGKLSLAWPAAAIGRRHVLRHGWVMSSGLAPQLTVTLLQTSLPFHAAALGLIYLDMVLVLPLVAQAALAVGAALLMLGGLAAGATALSFTYRWRLRQDNSHWWRHAG